MLSRGMVCVYILDKELGSGLVGVIFIVPMRPSALTALFKSS